MTTTPLFQRLWRIVAGLPLILSAATATAGNADLADRPLSSMANGTVVRANLMFVLDNSGSMGFNYLPDNAPTGNVCFGWVGANKIFYDPNRTYPAPLNPDGTPMADASFTAAKNDGYSSTSGTTDLSNQNPETPDVLGATIGTPTTTVTSAICGARNEAACTVPASSSTSTYDSANDRTTTVVKTYSRIPTVPGGSCRNNVANSCTMQTTTTTTVTDGDLGPFLWATPKPGNTGASCQSVDFDIVRVKNATTAQKQNYANWYSYYRTRMLAMRAGAGMAFAKIDATRFRVGFSKISEYANGGANSTGFLNVADFDAGTQKTEFFKRLYGTATSGNTPLRPALARAGRYFANKLSGQTDPMQYACQRNYTILSTDGYWNQATVIPKQVDGTTDIGNPDGGTSIDRPIRDEANNGAGVSNTLADVAQYYYITDLRTPALNNCTGSIANQDVCDNIVPTDRKDNNSAQHMTTFTLGLGLNGTLTYVKDYETRQSGDYFDIKQGTKIWPEPVADTLTAVDDLWHAAVNGRGTYYSANNAAEMATSLVDALSRIEASTGSSSAAATSSLTPSSGDDWIFIPLYTTKTWDGTVNAFKLNTATGDILNPGTPIWSAADRIKAQGTRKILFNSGVNTLVEFNATNLTAAGKLSLFDNLCVTGSEKLTQCTTMDAAAKPKATAANLIEYLRGATTYEQSASAAADQVFRTRAGPMGDVVNGAPVYVKKSPLGLTDTGYAAFAATTATRTGVLYVGANDGMLHAIKVADDSTGGTELWAYVPSMVMSNMYLLADANYESKHRFYVDGAPVVGDIYDGTKWRTILVGGLGKGGRGYYALDITDPNAPIALWEYTETDLGYTYGNPIITKNKAGRWVVMFSSGYNNVSPGSGLGYLYVLDAVTGVLMPNGKIATTAGSTSTPSNLGKINAWVDDDKLGVAARVYGGDMLGNVWRFDFDDNLAPSGKESMLLGQTGSNQPITTRPVLTEIIDGNYKYAVVSVATGRYLGTTDVGDSSLQSIYTFKDELGTTGLGALRSNSGMVKQTLAADRSGLQNGATINWATQKGWYVDLNLTSGERVNVDFDQQLNQLIVASNIPTPTVCSPGGTGWLYYLDVGSGKPLKAYSVTTLIAGITPMVTSTGKQVTLLQRTDGVNDNYDGAPLSTATPGSLRRISWRELMN
ncbi:pilus assembly protein [Roseateles puraquae]|uniref:Pilus assembly protein PilY n=1 Tax=Roseateles puraquae TaxID=431059 RepID=A0A254NJ05_9BURK|nr:PilC/PilY family type IV pilus protein [Roseateles puraquae]MDG0854629.1 pilus assembly protein PilY [Roseateles puraquae]OWR06017.1 pilus assembly protein PilY [Roseateles puraquae]